MTERDWQRTVVEAAQLYGWRVKCDRNVRVQRKDGSTYFTTAIGANGIGFPDLLLLRPPRVIVAELKVGRNKPTEAQREWLECFADCDVETYTWRPEDWPEVQKALRAN